MICHVQTSHKELNRDFSDDLREWAYCTRTSSGAQLPICRAGSGKPVTCPHVRSSWEVMPFYERGKSRETLPRRLEGAKIFAVLSSLPNVGRLWGFWFLVDSFCGRDGAFGSEALHPFRGCGQLLF